MTQEDSFRVTLDRDARSEQIVQELKGLIPEGGKILLVDELHLPCESWTAAGAIVRFDSGWGGPFPEASVLSQLERFHRSGVQFVVFAWPALWWLRHYAALGKRLHAISQDLKVGDGYALFDLRAKPEAAGVAQSTEASGRQSEAVRQAAQRELERVRTQFQEKLASLESSHRQTLTLARQNVARLQEENRALVRERKRWEDTVAYAQWQPRMAAFLHHQLPPTANLLVVSQGDTALLHLSGRPGGHFPQMPDGAHAGAPADNAEAIAHLAELRKRGFTHLLLPSWTDWWFEHYQEFGRHLNQQHHLVGRNSDFSLYELSPAGSSNPAAL